MFSKTFYNNIINRPSFCIHRDRDTILCKYLYMLFSCILTPLVLVKDFSIRIECFYIYKLKYGSFLWKDYTL